MLVKLFAFLFYSASFLPLLLSLPSSPSLAAATVRGLVSLLAQARRVDDLGVLLGRLELVVAQDVLDQALRGLFNPDVVFSTRLEPGDEAVLLRKGVDFFCRLAERVAG